MSTSAWQSIPFCVDALLKIGPRRVLDVGAGFGRWGMLVREFCERWLATTGAEAERVHVEGIEIEEAHLGPHHDLFYDRMHVGDAAEVLPGLDESWDLIVLGNVLEHLTREKGLRLIQDALARATYVVVNVSLGTMHPEPQGNVAPNDYRRSDWARSDFDAFPVVRRAWFSDGGGRPVTSLILSNEDSRDLRTGLFSPTGDYRDESAHPGLSYELEQAINAIGDVATELRYIKGHGTYKLARRLRRSRLWNLARRLRGRERLLVKVRASGRSNPESKGTEAWLLHVGEEAGEHAVPWDFVECVNGWDPQQVEGRPYGQCLVSQTGGLLQAPAGEDPELRFMTHPFSGFVSIEYRNRCEIIDLYSPHNGELCVYPARVPMVRPEDETPAGSDGTSPVVKVAPFEPYTKADAAFLAKVAKDKPRAVAVHCPRWMGVTHSTRTLFECTYAVPETPDKEPYQLDADRLARHADVLCESGIDHIVFSGGDEIHFDLMRMIRARKPDVRCDLLWHGGYLFFEKEYDWNVLRKWMDAGREGEVTLMGTVKKGMEKFFEEADLPSRLILNYYPGTPAETPKVEGAGWHIGLWMSDMQWKVPHAMLSALRIIPNAHLHAAGLSRRAEEVARYFNIPIDTFHPGKLPQAKLHEEIRRTHLTMYVTFTECCPMLPLESISLGVPSLIGPSSHLFEDNPFLAERLIVPYPERAEIIAEYAVRALEERDAIMDECRRYIADYNERARRSVEEFLAPI